MNAVVFLNISWYLLGQHFHVFFDAQAAPLYSNEYVAKVSEAHLLMGSFHESRNPRKLYDKWRQHLSRYPDAKTYFRRKVKTRKPPQVVPK